MTGFNLPPGVEVHHIPGNRPEDDNYERFHTNIEKMLEESVGEARAAHFFEYIDKGDWEEVLIEFIDIAAGLASAQTLLEVTYEREMEQNG